MCWTLAVGPLQLPVAVPPSLTRLLYALYLGAPTALQNCMCISVCFLWAVPGRGSYFTCHYSCYRCYRCSCVQQLLGRVTFELLPCWPQATSTLQPVSAHNVGSGMLGSLLLLFAGVATSCSTCTVPRCSSMGVSSVAVQFGRQGCKYCLHLVASVSRSWPFTCLSLHKASLSALCCGVLLRGCVHA